MKTIPAVKCLLSPPMNYVIMGKTFDTELGPDSQQMRLNVNSETKSLIQIIAELLDSTNK